MPFSVNNSLLKAADKYCIIEVWPNLKCIFADPKIILNSLIIWINGKWYKPASGRLELSNTIIKAESEEIINAIIIKSLKFL